MKIPRAHQSTAFPWDLPDATSGATYSWVPTNEHDRAVTGSATNNRLVENDCTFFDRNSRLDMQKNGGGEVDDSYAKSGDSTAAIESEQRDKSKSVSIM